MTREIVQYLMALDVKEIHGYEPAFGCRVFTPQTVAMEFERVNGRAHAAVNTEKQSVPVNSK